MKKNNKSVSINNKDEALILDRNYWLNKINNSDSKFNEYINYFEFAPDSILEDYELMMKACLDLKTSFYNIGPKLSQDKKFVLEYIDKKDYFWKYSISSELFKDEDIFLKAFEKNADVFQCLSHDSPFITQDYIDKLLNINLDLLKYVGHINRYNENKDLMMAFIQKDINNVKCFKKSILNKLLTDKDECKNLLDKNNIVFKYLNIKLRNDVDFVTPYILNNKNLLKYAGNKLKNNFEFMKQFVSYYDFYDILGNSLKNNQEMLLLLVSYNPRVVHQVSIHPEEKDFYIKAIEMNPKVYEFLYSCSKKDPDIIHSFLSSKDYFEYKSNYNLEKTKIDKTKILPYEIVEDIVKGMNQEEIDLISYLKNYYLNLYLKNHLAATEPSKKLKI